MEADDWMGPSDPPAETDMDPVSTGTSGRQREEPAVAGTSDRYRAKPADAGTSGKHKTELVGSETSGIPYTGWS